jgi:hypothetical protein
MVDDRPEDTGPSAESGRPKRPAPTIDLEATEVSGDTRNAAADGTQPEPAPQQRSASALFPVITGAVAGAAAAALVFAVAWFL